LHYFIVKPKLSSSSSLSLSSSGLSLSLQSGEYATITTAKKLKVSAATVPVISTDARMSNGTKNDLNNEFERNFHSNKSIYDTTSPRNTVTDDTDKNVIKNMEKNVDENNTYILSEAIKSDNDISKFTAMEIIFPQHSSSINEIIENKILKSIPNIPIMSVPRTISPITDLKRYTWI
jgi:hypothetical protein